MKANVKNEQENVLPDKSVAVLAKINDLGFGLALGKHQLKRLCTVQKSKVLSCKISHRREDIIEKVGNTTVDDLSRALVLGHDVGG
ncbi:hypothetical protein B296_00048973, partial [Ensete ventricosum]